MTRCIQCNGTGKVLIDETASGVRRVCPACKGTRRKSQCTRCCGAGYVKEGLLARLLDFGMSDACPICSGTGIMPGFQKPIEGDGK